MNSSSKDDESKEQEDKKMKVKHECNRKKNDDQMIKRKPLIQDLIHSL